MRHMPKWIIGATVPIAAGVLAAAAAAAVPGMVRQSADLEPAASGPAGAAGAHPGGDVRQVCAPSTGPQDMTCMSVLPVGEHGAARPVFSGSAYGPADLQSAYELTAASRDRGKGETVAVVDAYSDPRAAADLAVYRKQWGLPPCAAGCLTILNEHGRTGPLPGTDPTGGWELEESIDLDMVSAICPDCHIEVVEANSTSIDALGAAEDAAAASGAKFISNSWGGHDYYGASAYDGYFDHPGVAITAAAGDAGFGPSYPATSQFVTSVGGTTLVRAPGTARGWKESVWSGTGSGCSLSEPKPSWQAADDFAPGGCLNRTDNDVAAVADASTPVWLYDSYPYQGSAPQWAKAGGTSVASPVIASVYALAGAPLSNSYPASYLYQHASHLFPVTSGSNGPCEATRPYLCSGGSGFNGPAGWGTPDGTAAFAAPGRTITVFNPGFQDDGTGAKVRLRVKALDSAGQRLSYSASGLPRGLSIGRSTGLITGRLPAAAATDKVTVTAADASGARGTAWFSFVIAPDLRASYHPVTGPVTLDVARLCLDDAGDSARNGAKIQVWTCDRRSSQRWTYLPDRVPDGAGVLTIHGKCLDIIHDGATQGSRLQLWQCTGGANQEWSLRDGSSNLLNPASGDCLDDPGSSRRNGTQVEVLACESAANQAFLLPPAPVTSAIHGKCLDVPGDGRVGGTPVDIADCNAGPAQLWGDFSSDTMKPATHGGLCLAAFAPFGPPDGLQWAGSPVRMEACGTPDPAIEDVWSILPDGQIMNDTASLCIDDPGNSTASGTKLVLEDCYGEAGEIWAVG